MLDSQIGLYLLSKLGYHEFSSKIAYTTEFINFRCV